MIDKNRKILFIPYHYPPRGGVAVIRTIKFLKYLYRLGWFPYVLTLKTNRYIMKDLTLENEIPSRVKVYRVPEFGKRFFNLMWKVGLEKWTTFPDNAVGWVPLAAREASKLIQRHNIPVIYTTSPPHSTHLVGYLCKCMTDVRWVADFRDLWCGNCFFVPESGILKTLHEKLENQVIKKADVVLANTPKALSYFMETYPAVSEKFDYIPNGFDPDDFKGICSRIRKDKLNFTYVGTYGGGRPMDFFFQALREFLNEFPMAEEEIEVIFIGLESVLAQRLRQKFKLDNIITFAGHRSHKESIRFMKESNVLLLFQFEGHGGSTAIPSKVFEYMKAGKPIFAQVCDGPSTDLIKNYKGGYVTEPRNIEQIKRILKELYKLYKRGELNDINDPSIDQFSRVTHSIKLNDLLSRVVDKK